MSATPVLDEPGGRWLTFSAYASELGITRQALDLRVKQDQKLGLNKYRVRGGKTLDNQPLVIGEPMIREIWVPDAPVDVAQVIEVQVGSLFDERADGIADKIGQAAGKAFVETLEAKVMPSLTPEALKPVATMLATTIAAEVVTALEPLVTRIEQATAKANASTLPSPEPLPTAGATSAPGQMTTRDLIFLALAIVAVGLFAWYVLGPR